MNHDVIADISNMITDLLQWVCVVYLYASRNPGKKGSE